MRWTWVGWLVLLVGCRSDGEEVDLEVEVQSPCVAELEARVRMLERELTELRTWVTLIGCPRPGICSWMPHIKGAVLMTSDEVSPGLVSINRGSADNVQRGFTFEIYSGGEYKGRVRVVEVQEHECTAIVERLYEGRSIEPGDSAATLI